MINVFKKISYIVLTCSVFSYFIPQSYAMKPNTIQNSSQYNIRILKSNDIQDESDWIEIDKKGELSLILRVKPIKQITNFSVLNCPEKELKNWWDNSKNSSPIKKFADNGPFFLDSKEVKQYFCKGETAKYRQNTLKNMLTVSKSYCFGTISKSCCSDTGIGYLRDGEKSCFYAHLFDEGTVKYDRSSSEQVSLRPALLVRNEIFDEKILNQIENHIEILNKFSNQDKLIKTVKMKLFTEFKKPTLRDGKSLHMVLLNGDSPEYRQSVARCISNIYDNCTFINNKFIVIDEKNYNASDYGKGLLFFDTEKMNNFLENNFSQTAQTAVTCVIAQNLSDIIDKQDCSTVILGGTEESMNKFFEANQRLKEKFNENNTVYLNKKITCFLSDVDKDFASISKQNISTNSKQKLSISDCMKPLESLVGMKNFKSFVKGLIISERQRKIDEKYGIIRKKPNLHMVITGNPGTGKTTVVNMLGKILFDAGLIEKESIVSVERADLVDSVVGGSEALTRRKLTQAKGGILFIDEAYALTDGNSGSNDNDFGRRVIEGLLNPLAKDDCVIILAGYPEKMEQFINFNPGLTRRFAPDHRIFLPDYTKEELFEIFNNLCMKCGLKLENGSEDILLRHFEIMKKVDNFGNAGYAEKLFEKVMKNRDYYWQEVLGENCEELTSEQSEERKFVKKDYIKAAIYEFESGIKSKSQDIPSYIC